MVDALLLYIWGRILCKMKAFLALRSWKRSVKEQQRKVQPQPFHCLVPGVLCGNGDVLLKACWGGFISDSFSREQLWDDSAVTLLKDFPGRLLENQQVTLPSIKANHSVLCAG